jgi:hypothetical protein
MSYPVDEYSDRLLRHWAESNGEKDEANSFSEENLWPGQAPLKLFRIQLQSAISTEADCLQPC